MAELHIVKNLADKRKEIQAYIGSLERDLEKARRDLSAIIVTEHVFQAKGPNVTAYMELSFLFPRHELPRLARAAMEANPDGHNRPSNCSHVIAVKGLNADDRHLRRSISTASIYGSEFGTTKKPSPILSATCVIVTY